VATTIGIELPDNWQEYILAKLRAQILLPVQAGEHWQEKVAEQANPEL